MKKMRLILAAVMIMVLTVGVAGCGSAELADCFDEETVTETAEEVVDLLNAGDYEGVTTYFSEEMKTALPADKLEESVKGILEAAGAFGEYDNVAVIGQANKQTGENNAVAVVVAKYENKKLTYTVSFDESMAVNGLYVK